MKYITLEQSFTSYNLLDRVFTSVDEKQNEILIEIDGNRFSNEDFRHIQNMSEILANDKELEIGTFQIGNLQITINDLKTYEEGLIKLRKLEWK